MTLSNMCTLLLFKYNYFPINYASKPCYTIILAVLVSYEVQAYSSKTVKLKHS